MKVLFLQAKEWEVEYIQKQMQSLSDIEQVDFIVDPVDEVPVEKLSEYDVISPFIHSPFSKELLEKLPNLKLIPTRSTGFDHVDLAAAAEHNITVSNVPSYGVNTVAEQAFALLLSLSRKIPESIDRTRESDFDREGLQGFDLAGKTMGVVGTGRIGYHTVKIANGFGMKVIAYDPYPNDKVKEEFGVEYMELHDLLSQADVVSLHVPYMKETHHILDKEAFSKMKKGTVLINTARGPLVDNDALIDALQDGTLAGAGLDVMEGEELLEDELELLDQKNVSKESLETLLEGHVILTFDNVIVTPHNAFNTREALMRIIDTTIGNIKAFQAGSPENVVEKK